MAHQYIPKILHDPQKNFQSILYNKCVVKFMIFHNVSHKL